MPEPIISSVVVNYTDCGEKKSKELKFKGDFVFDINGNLYRTKEGKIFDFENKEVTNLNLSKAEAYQILGMSCLAEGARDYTYSEKDIQQARKNHTDTYVWNATAQGMPFADYQAQVTIGNGAGRVSKGSTKYSEFSLFGHKYEGYTTEYGNEKKSNISVWQVK